jgi:hypothetical protein
MTDNSHNLDYRHYFAFRHFPELAKSFREAKSLEQTLHITQQRPRTACTSVNTRAKLPKDYDSTMYELNKKLDRLAKTSVLDELPNHLQAARKGMKSQNSSRKNVLTNANGQTRSNIESFNKGSFAVDISIGNPLESAFRKLASAGFPGISNENRSYTIYVDSFLSVLDLRNRRVISPDEVSSSCLRTLGVKLTFTESAALSDLLTNSRK